MIVIIDCGIGNLQSVVNAFEAIGCQVCVSNSSKDVEKSERIVLPGVGSFANGMKNLRDLNLIETLYEQVIKKEKPFLCICLGMQLLARDSDEKGFHKGLGWIPASVKKLQPNDKDLRIPHVGWNDVSFGNNIPLFAGLGRRQAFYFVHSYHVILDSPDIVTGTCDYGGNFAAAIQKDNIFAVQFHPEKSHKSGLQILKNFCELD